MRRSNSRSVQSSGRESTICWKVSARPMSLQAYPHGPEEPAVAMLETMAATDTDRLHEEYRTLTETCGLVDRSDRGKLALTGAGAVEFLNGQVTNELADVPPGEGRYAAFLTHKGKMLGDLRILAVGEDPDDEAPIEL